MLATKRLPRHTTIDGAPSRMELRLDDGRPGPRPHAKARPDQTSNRSHPRIEGRTPGNHHMLGKPARVSDVDAPHRPAATASSRGRWKPLPVFTLGLLARVSHGSGCFGRNINTIRASPGPGYYGPALFREGAMSASRYIHTSTRTRPAGASLMTPPAQSPFRGLSRRVLTPAGTTDGRTSKRGPGITHLRTSWCSRNIVQISCSVYPAPVMSHEKATPVPQSRLVHRRPPPPGP